MGGKSAGAQSRKNYQCKHQQGGDFPGREFLRTQEENMNEARSARECLNRKKVTRFSYREDAEAHPASKGAGCPVLRVGNSSDLLSRRINDPQVRRILKVSLTDRNSNKNRKKKKRPKKIRSWVTCSFQVLVQGCHFPWKSFPILGQRQKSRKKGSHSDQGGRIVRQRKMEFRGCL